MSEAIFLRRQNILKNELANRGLDGMLITNLTNVRYLSGFTGSAGTCLFTPQGQSFISDGRYLEQSKAQVKGFTRYIDTGTHLQIAAKNKLIPGGLKLGFEGDFVSVNLFQQMRDLFPAVQWEATSRLVEEIAAVKDPTELETIKTAAEITDRVFEEVLPGLKAGITEKEVATEFVIRFRRYGDGEAYSPIVASGPNGALPHAVPTDRPLQKGDFVVIDAAAKYGGYHSDLTRTPVIGEASGKHREIYEIVKAAQQAGCDAARAGMSCKDLDSVTRDYITEHGYGEYYVHSTGHGLGLEIHTIPRVSQQSREVLQENYVVTIEPGIYLPKWGGVRIEDDVVIKADGCEILNRTTKDLMVVG
ncbi:MAG: aminopeptidase P family protein [FCB group bacterium]|nr:aminopeptidase P family protein [FCB group bacterium]